MAKLTQIEASKLPPLTTRLDALDKQEAEQQQEQSHPNPALSAPDLSRLEGMTRDELVGLIRKVSQAGWGYGKLTGKELLETALKTKDEAYEALKLTALTLAVNASDWREFNALATFWAEREKGKPAGAATNINIGPGNGEKKIQIVFMNADDVKKEREAKLIDVTPRV
jgi:hypothetical protein